MSPDFDTEAPTQPLALIPDETSDRIVAEWMERGREQAQRRERAEARRLSLLRELTNTVVRIP